MSAEIGAIDIMKPSRAQSRALDRVAHARPGSLMRLSLGGGAGLAIGAARALGAAEDGSRDGSAVFGVDRARSALRVCRPPWRTRLHFQAQARRRRP